MASYACNARAQHLSTPAATATTRATATATAANNHNTQQQSAASTAVVCGGGGGVGAGISGGININTALPVTALYSTHELAVENVMPGIYLTKNFMAWTESSLRAHGFTHIIIIDKHIQELYYPSLVFKLSTQNSVAQQQHHHTDDDPFDYYTRNTITNTKSASSTTTTTASTTALSFGKEFEAIDLNFGVNSYLTTVLPNCYRAVRFINKALQSGGTILVIDCNGGEQKCVTIVVAYLMFKHNISFSNAFARLKDHYNKADLDRFYTSQLYEYEPILQVQRAQSRGHSCSRELHAAILKRKKTSDDYDVAQCTNDFFVNLNPLSQFNANNQTLLPTYQSHVTQGNVRIQQQDRQHHHPQQLQQPTSTQQTTTTATTQTVTVVANTTQIRKQEEELELEQRNEQIEIKYPCQQQLTTIMSYNASWEDYAME